MSIKSALAWPLLKALELSLKTVVTGLNVGPEWYARNGYARIAQVLGVGRSTHTGRTVSQETAENCSTFWACVEIISREIAFLPFHLYQRGTDDGRKKAREHPLYEKLRMVPSEYSTALHFRHAIQRSTLITGNGFARVFRRSGNGEIRSMVFLPPGAIKIDVENGEPVYILHGNGESGDKKLSKGDIFHVKGPSDDGLVGKSVLDLARQTIALSNVQEEYVSKFFGKGGRRPYKLHRERPFQSQEESDQFREQWDKVYSSADDFHKGVMTWGAMEYQELGFSMEDAQLLGSRQFSVLEICRWFLMQPHMAGDLSRATFSNIEHQFLEHIKMTLMYWAVNWEQEVYRQLLTDSERKTLYAEFDMNALERGDFATRMEGYSKALRMGKDSIDEIRARENQNPLANGSGGAHYIPLDLQTVPGTGERTAAEEAALAKTRTAAPSQ